VIYAVMEGATKLIHGVIPYGHLPGDVVHGDTYPILSYALYSPLAWIAPVGSVWDSVDLALGIGVTAALGCAVASYRLAVPRSRASRDPEVELAGLRAALLTLSFPPLLAIVSTGTTDVVLAALLCVAVLTWRRPGWSTGALAAAGWFKLAPFALLPFWLAPRRGRQLVSALVGVAAVSVAMLALLVGLAGAGGISAMVHSVSFQLTRGSLQSLWSALAIGEAQPWGQAAVLAVIAGAAVRLWREPELASDRTRMAALAAAVMLAVQLVGDYWAFLYLAWIVPLLTGSLLAEKPQRVSNVAEAMAFSARPVGGEPATALAR
jgi:Glycosyltransferase family 87